jgi:hypothetical protein
MRTTLEPPYTEWISTLQENLRRSGALHTALGSDAVSRIRSALVDEAARYTEMLISKAKTAGIPIKRAALPSYEPGKPIVSVGHQPLIYHWGLLYKNLRLSQLARETNSFGINSIIDTDVGDAGRIIWPHVRDNSISIKEGSVAEGPELYFAQRVVSRERLAELFSGLQSDLKASGLSDAAKRGEEVADYYARLSGEPIVIANSLVRWVYEERDYYEVPLSHVLQIPEVSNVLQALIRDYKRVVTVYNDTLTRYRAEHKIKNAANPFPNMKIEGDDYELPLWEVSETDRRPLIVSQGEVARRSNTFVAPRGSIVTLLMRGYCSDIAVHGLGGARYDPFVDAFARALYGVELPNYLVASATRYLFPEVVERYQRAREIKARYKEMVSHTEKFFGQALFSREDEATLEPLLQHRKVLLEGLKLAQSPEQRSEVAHQLNALNRDIKSRIDGSAVAPLLADAAIEDSVLARWACREFPFFFIRETE